MAPEFTFAMFLYFNAVAVFMMALLPLRYPNQNPFLTLPTTMIVLVSSTTLYYLLLIGIHLFPRSRFSAMAKHLTLFFAYAAVSSFVAALFLGRRATTAIYTIFGLVVAGHALLVLGVFGVEDDDIVNEDEAQDQTWYEGFTNTCRHYKKILVSSVAAFFHEQTAQPAEQPLPC